MRTLAIGDIHGMSPALDALLTLVRPTLQDRLVFLGDYVDRGPDSKGVIDRILNLSQTYRTVCLKGNHEIMMERARHDRNERKMWLAVGGLQAMASYSTSGRSTYDDIPERHWQFMDDCLPYWETDTHIFVHANLDEHRSLADQVEQKLYWEHLHGPIRHHSGKAVICGHTSQSSGLPLAWPTTICIDTKAHADGGWLTCLEVGTTRYWQANGWGQTRQGELVFQQEV
jgi:serine/threonine protein phosphatase 1